MKVDRKQDLNILYQVCVFSGRSEKQDGRPGLWLAETFSTSPLKPLNGIQRNLTGSKISTSSTKFVFLGSIGKNKMATLASDWLRHFRLLLWNRWTEYSESWQEARSQRLLPSLCFSGWWEKKGGTLYSGARYVALWASCLMWWWTLLSIRTKRWPVAGKEEVPRYMVYIFSGLVSLYFTLNRSWSPERILLGNEATNITQITKRPVSKLKQHARKWCVSGVAHHILTIFSLTNIFCLTKLATFRILWFWLFTVCWQWWI